MHRHFWTSSCELLGAPWVNKLRLHFTCTRQQIKAISKPTNNTNHLLPPTSCSTTSFAATSSSTVQLWPVHCQHIFTVAPQNTIAKRPLNFVILGMLKFLHTGVHTGFQSSGFEKPPWKFFLIEVLGIWDFWHSEVKSVCYSVSIYFQFRRFDWTMLDLAQMWVRVH